MASQNSLPHRYYFAKVIIVLTLTFAMTLFAIPTPSGVLRGLFGVMEASAAPSRGWFASSGQWYYYENGVPFSRGWKEIYHSGRWDWYYFNGNGTMATGWLNWGGSWFYLADSWGQGVDFSSTYYGTMRMGWQWIYHATGWDWYYFHGGNSGRMATGWFSDGGHYYYLADPGVGIGFYDSDYGTCLQGLYEIGLHTYYFRQRDMHDISGTYFPVGAMVRNASLNLFFSDRGIWTWVEIDADGRCAFYYFIRDASGRNQDNGTGISSAPTDSADKTGTAAPFDLGGKKGQL